jgi:uncharacterized membrane protein YkoI
MPAHPLSPIIVATAVALALFADASSAALSLGEVSRQFEANGKRVLAAQQKQHQGKPMYRFKLLTPEGRVRKVWIDPNTGRQAR